MIIDSGLANWINHIIEDVESVSHNEITLGGCQFLLDFWWVDLNLLSRLEWKWAGIIIFLFPTHEDS